MHRFRLPPSHRACRTLLAAVALTLPAAAQDPDPTPTRRVIGVDENGWPVFADAAPPQPAPRPAETPSAARSAPSETRRRGG